MKLKEKSGPSDGRQSGATRRSWCFCIPTPCRAFTHMISEQTVQKSGIPTPKTIWRHHPILSGWDPLEFAKLNCKCCSKSEHAYHVGARVDWSRHRPPYPRQGKGATLRE